MKRPLLILRVERDRDIVRARQRARQIAALVGFDVPDQTRIATAISELARIAIDPVTPGTIRAGIDEGEARQSLIVQVTMRAPERRKAGASPLDPYQSGADIEMSIVAARRLMDGFRMETLSDSSISIHMTKILPRRMATLTAARLAGVVGQLDIDVEADPYQEIEEQNRELLASLEELRQRQEELSRLNAELADTNRGVVALYAELDERAEQLRLANEAKTRFLSNVSHEFRTPVNAIRALGRMLLQRADGELTSEQERQVNYIAQAATQLGQFVDDLLDLAKVEAGKVEIRPELFTVADLFGALRGMLKPLLVNESVALVFSGFEALPPLVTDRGKLSQILRNLLSNALKFTERGSVTVTAFAVDEGKSVRFQVVDTGIGIANADLERIFDEFVQINSPLQSKVKGTGLGLPLSRRLAETLGGALTVESVLGRGSTFTITLPRIHAPASREPASGASIGTVEPRVGRVLIVDDDEIERYALRQVLALPADHVVEAADGIEGLRLARQSKPDLMFLDLTMPGMQGFDLLSEIRADAEMRNTPVIIFTSRDLDADDRRRLVAADAIVLKSALSREVVAQAMVQALNRVNA